MPPAQSMPTAINQSNWSECKNGYLERYRKAFERMDELEAAKRECLGKSKIIQGFIRDIKSRPLAITVFDENLWLAVITDVKVSRDGSIGFRFKNGSEITL